MINLRKTRKKQLAFGVVFPTEVDEELTPTLSLFQKAILCSLNIGQFNNIGIGKNKEISPDWSGSDL